MKYLSTLILAITTSQVIGDCVNPVFTASADWGDNSISITLSTNTTTVPDDSNICVAYRGHDSCCSPDTLQAVDQAVSVTHNAIEATKKAIANLNIRNDLQINLIDIACSATFSFGQKAGHCKDITTNGVNRMQDKVKQLAQNALQCADSMLGYKAGMLCFACTANWSDYVDIENQYIKLSKSTCDNIVASCAPMMNDSKDLMVIFADMIKQLIELGLNASIDVSAKFPDFCGGTKDKPGDCAKIICDEWLNALHYNIQTRFGSSRRMLLSASSPFYEEHPEMSDLFTEILESVEHVLEPLAALNTQTTGVVVDVDDGSSSRRRYLSTSSSSKNQYTNDGYDAYSVGCQEPRTHCPNLYFWWWVVGGGVCVAIILAIVGMEIYKRRTNSGESMTSYFASI